MRLVQLPVRGRKGEGGWFPCVFLSGMLAVAGGCGRSDIVRVTGRVTHGGAAVPDAVMRFIPANRPEAIGRTDADGVYSLSTFQKGDGCFIGNARVVVIPWETPFESLPDDHLTGRKPPPGKQRPDIPLRFRQAHTSPLSVDVIAGQKNEHNFSLDD